MKLLCAAILFSFALISCTNGAATNENTTEEPSSGLPYIGFHETDITVVDGVQQTDTVYHVVPSYTLMAQDSSTFTNERVKNKVHVANFFFTSCPAICPAMIAQMQRLQNNTGDIEELTFLSHTIDPRRDSIPKLRAYIAEKNIDTKNWYFLYGDKKYVHDLGIEGYMVNAMEDEAAAGGFLHSEHFVLIDREGHIRGLYTGTDTDEVDRLEKDIRKLLKIEYGYE